ncbi:MAG TPA: amidohydrolase family protein [Myxococcota bacterium]|nr:amidohydrolase family protein [Myxococcota bacterium]HRY91815.1 amidohydrolase family protein [Myxococcota bacterium]HSA23086.1 amidohydrolase family protein [Myxococcota bacterium]
MRAPIASALAAALLLWAAGCPEPLDGADGGPATAGPAGRPPMVDSHVHLLPSPRALARALALFDQVGVTRFCAKSAGVPGSGRYRATLAVQRRLGERFAFFVNPDWDGFGQPGWLEREVGRLEVAARDGARGVKIFKALGLSVRDPEGRLVPVDDPRLDPWFEAAGRLGLIVAIHTADPLTFFDPPGPRNERHLELLFAPNWSFAGEGLPSKAELLAQRDRRLARHPGTTFLGIHLANSPEDLGYVDRLLDARPNLLVDTSARVPEFGRHPPAEVRAFFLEHQARILFGTDIVIDEDSYQLGSLSIWPDEDQDAVRFFQAHRDFFETERRGLRHPTPIQGAWTVDGIGLPREALDRIYRQNAERLIWKVR